jgi:hypothetical protein
MNATPGASRSLVWSLFNDSVHRQGPAADLFATYHAGLQRELHRNPYRPPSQPEAVPYENPYRYLPVVAQTLGRAMTHFDPRTVYIAWIFLLEAVLGALAFFFLRFAPAPWLRVVAPCLLLLSTPFFLELHMGQASFMTAALFEAALFLCAMAPRGAMPTSLAAIAYALSVFLKMVPAVAAPALLRTRRGLAVASVALITVAAISIPAFVSHPVWWQGFSEINLTPQVPGPGAGNFGWMFLIFEAGTDFGVHWTDDNWATAVHAAQLLFIGIAVVAALTSGETSPLIGGAALYLGHTLSFFHVWEHHMSGVVVVGLGLLWALTDRPRLDRWQVTVLAALFCLALPSPFRLFDHALDPGVDDPTGNWPAYARYLVPLSKALPVLVLYLVALRRLLNTPADAVRGPPAPAGSPP